MNSRSEKYVFEQAIEADAPGILALLEEEASRGAISLKYTRRPDPVESFGRDCDSDIIVGRDLENGKVIALGVCDYRDLYVNGKPERVGYFHSMKVAREYRKMLPVSRGFEKIYDVARNNGSNYFILTILEGNDEGRQFLEKKRNGMPWHEYLCDYDLYAIKTGRSRKLPAGYALRIATGNEIENLVEFINMEGASRQFYPVLSVDDILRGKYPGLDIGCFRFLENSENQLLAAGAVWDQSSYKQYLVSGYNGLLGKLYPVSFAFPMFGLPSLPKPGSILSFFTLSFYASVSPAAFDVFLNELTSACRDWPFYLVGAARNDPAAEIIASRRHIKYSSRLYLVNLEMDVSLKQSINQESTPYLEGGLL